MKRKKLIKAIKYISKVCRQRDDCSNCPMLIGEWTTNGYCMFESTGYNSELMEPAHWKLRLKSEDLKLNSTKEGENDE